MCKTCPSDSKQYHPNEYGAMDGVSKVFVRRAYCSWKPPAGCNRMRKAPHVNADIPNWNAASHPSKVCWVGLLSQSTTLISHREIRKSNSWTRKWRLFSCWEFGNWGSINILSLRCWRLESSNWSLPTVVGENEPKWRATRGTYQPKICRVYAQSSSKIYCTGSAADREQPVGIDEYASIDEAPATLVQFLFEVHAANARLCWLLEAVWTHQIHWAAQLNVSSNRRRGGVRSREVEGRLCADARSGLFQSQKKRKSLWSFEEVDEKPDDIPSEVLQRWRPLWTGREARERSGWPHRSTDQQISNLTTFFDYHILSVIGLWTPRWVLPSSHCTRASRLLQPICSVGVATCWKTFSNSAVLDSKVHIHQPRQPLTCQKPLG